MAQRGKGSAQTDALQWLSGAKQGFGAALRRQLLPQPLPAPAPSPLAMPRPLASFLAPEAGDGDGKAEPERLPHAVELHFKELRR